MRTLLRLFIYLHRDLPNGNTHLQLLSLHTRVFTQIVHKHWDQVMTEKGKTPKLTKSEVSYFNTFTDIRERAKTAK